MEIRRFRCRQSPSLAGRAAVVAVVGRANDDDAVVTNGIIIYLGSVRAGRRVIYSARGVYARRSIFDRPYPSTCTPYYVLWYIGTRYSVDNMVSLQVAPPRCGYRRDYTSPQTLNTMLYIIYIADRYIVLTACTQQPSVPIVIRGLHLLLLLCR